MYLKVQWNFIIASEPLQNTLYIYIYTHTHILYTGSDATMIFHFKYRYITWEDITDSISSVNQ